MKLSEKYGVRLTFSKNPSRDKYNSLNLKTNKIVSNSVTVEEER